MKQHPWFKGIDWKLMLDKKLRAPYIPFRGTTNFDPRTAATLDASESDQLLKNPHILRQEDVQNFFSGYYYSAEEDLPQLSAPIPRLS